MAETTPHLVEKRPTNQAQEPAIDAGRGGRECNDAADVQQHSKSEVRGKWIAVHDAALDALAPLLEQRNARVDRQRVQHGSKENQEGVHLGSDKACEQAADWQRVSAQEVAAIADGAHIQLPRVVAVVIHVSAIPTVGAWSARRRSQGASFDRNFYGQHGGALTRCTGKSNGACLLARRAAQSYALTAGMLNAFKRRVALDAHSNAVGSDMTHRIGLHGSGPRLPFRQRTALGNLEIVQPLRGKRLHVLNLLGLKHLRLSLCEHGRELRVLVRADIGYLAVAKFLDRAGREVGPSAELEHVRACHVCKTFAQGLDLSAGRSFGAHGPTS